MLREIAGRRQGMRGDEYSEGAGDNEGFSAFLLEEVTQEGRHTPQSDE